VSDAVLWPDLQAMSYVMLLRILSSALSFLVGLLSDSFPMYSNLSSNS
jgi:hypothetical protein